MSMEGKYHLILGDCLEKMTELPNEHIDLCLIDPPFNSETKMASPFRPNSKTKMSEEEWFIYNNMSSRGYISWMNRIFKEFYRVLKKGSHLYVFCNWKNIRNTMDILESNFFIQKDVLVWDKEHFGVGFFYRPQTEFIIFASKGKPNTISSKGQANIFRIKRVNKPHSIVQKPVELMEKLIRLSSKQGDLVLDSFMGSGSTGVACMQSGREFIGIEINEGNYKVAENRIKECSEQNNLRGYFTT